MPASALRRATRAPEKTDRTTAPERERVEWDDAVKGLGLRDRGGAERRWIVQTKTGGVKLKRTLGPERALSREEARAAARSLLAELRGETPPAVAAPPAFDPATTVAEFASRFLADCAGLWKASTAEQHGESLRLYVLPVLGDLRLAELTRPDVVSWRAALPVAAGTANRALAVLSGLCRHAELIGARPPGSNPCAGLRRRKSTFKARYLTEAEYRRLGDGLKALAATRPETAALIRFLALTGCRRDEARLLRWDWIEGGRAALPDSKGGPRAIWLAGPARALLAARPRTCGVVFARDEQPVGEAALSNAWGRLRAAAGLDGLRLHDLRHSFASVALSGGETLRTLAGLMGHAELATTEAYAHLAETPVREAAERMGTFLDKALAMRLPGRRRRSSGDAEVARYRASAMSLTAYCAAHGLDPDAFHARLRAVQKAEREALA